MLSIRNISPPLLSEDNNQQGIFQGENDSKHPKDKAPANSEVSAKSDSFADREDVTPTQIILAPHENSANVDNVVTDCDDTEVITNKPLQNELIQDDMTAQIINFEDKQPFKDKPIKNGAFEGIPTNIKENEGIVLNNMHVKKNFDETIDQFKRALQSPISVKSEIQNVPNENVITSDKTDESKSIDVVYNNATQDNKGKGEESKDSLVISSNTDDEVVQCREDGNVINNIKDENEIKYCGRDLPSQEQMDVLNESENIATLTNVSDSTDEEYSPKRSKQFTFSDSDLPDDDEIKEILMLYPKSTFIEPFSESESECISEHESNRPLCRRRRNKPEPFDITKMLEKLPERVLTRVRKQPDRLGFVFIKNITIFRPTYLTKQDDQIDEDIIVENINRLKRFRKGKTYSDSKKVKIVKNQKKGRSLRKQAVNKSNQHNKNIKVKRIRKNAKSKSKSNARKSAELKIKNTKDSLVSTSAAKRTTKKTRSMKNENDGKNTQIIRILLRNRNKKTNGKQKRTTKQERLAENKVRRSKRQQKAKQKTDDTVKAPISILKKSIHEQSTVYNISSSSSESPKGLKRSLGGDSDVPSPKRTRSHNANNNQKLNNINDRVKKTQHGHLTAFHIKELQQDKRGPYVYLEKYVPAQKRTRMLNSNRNSLNMKTRAQSAQRRSHRVCQRTRGRDC